MNVSIKSLVFLLLAILLMSIQCSGGQVALPCQDDVQCGAGFICVNNTCVPGERIDGGNEMDGGPDGGTPADGGNEMDGGPDGGYTDGGAIDGGSTDGGSTDGGLADGGACDEPKEFMCPCSDHYECRSGVCIQTLAYGSICTKNCSDCPPGPPHWGCRGVLGSGGLIRSVCFPYGEIYCIPCQSHTSCGNANDRCVDVGGANFCAQDCSGTSSCPSGYICTEFGEDGSRLDQRDGGVEDGGFGGDGGLMPDGGLVLDGGSAVDGGQGGDGGLAEDGGLPDGGMIYKLCVPLRGLCPGCLDGDNDHYGVGADCLGTDCDDTRDFIYQGAPEICDGYDNNCDGRTDELFNLNTDINNCGDCNKKCINEHGSTSCADGTCRPICDQGWGDCDSNPTNGCESPLASATYCGACLEDGQCPNGFYCNGVLCEKKHSDGQPCRRNTECVSTFCTDGVCCNTACDGKCQTCNMQGFKGICKFYNAGEDPENDCDDQGASTCGLNGLCDGSGNCAYFAINSVCEDASCDALRNEQTAERLCTGHDQCSQKVISSCSPYRCAAKACKTECVTTQDCMDGYVCLNPPVCEAGAGQPCTTGQNCGSHECWDGVCCDRRCDGSCRVCDAAGICRNHPVNRDPEDGCGSYQCDGAGHCYSNCSIQENCKMATHYCDGHLCQQKKPNGATCEQAYQCQSAYCTDGVCCQSACGGPCVACLAPDGACTNHPENTDPENGCGLYQCDSAGSCRLNCSIQAHCKTAGSYCNGTNCVPKKDKGSYCSNSYECATGNCVDQVCCESTCTDTCKACNLSGNLGNCLPVTNAEDLGTCTGIYLCDATGNCKLKNGQGCSDGNACASSYCKDEVCCDKACATACNACNLANSLGTCTPVMNAEDIPECSGLNSCNNEGLCKKKLGQSCSRDTDCVSAHCVDNLCCNTTCTGTCLACNNPGNPGICSILINAEDPGTCTGSQICDHEGQCKLKNGQACTDGNECASTRCKADHDGSGSWCANQNQCVHDGISYEDNVYSNGCFDEVNRAKCSNGAWVSEACGSNECSGTCGNGPNGCMYHLKGCTQNQGTCYDNSKDVDENQLYCTACSQSWSIGGETAQTTCCGDDPNEYVRNCTDNSTNGNCGNDVTACCEASTDCVDHLGNCIDASSCNVFGVDGRKSYCDNGTWRDPDNGQSFCTGCSFSWSIGGEIAQTSCCGDDENENMRNCIDNDANGTCGTDTLACCTTAQDCVDHNGNCKNANACYVFGSGGKKSFCDSGLWKDPDKASNYCTGCGFSWNIGGEVSAALCCGDDGNEHARNCSDSSSNGNCGIDTSACCLAATDCVDHDGNCKDANTCYVFGSGGKKSFCDNGTWRSPDDGQSYCTGCGFSWNIGGEIAASACCGDDASEYVRTCTDDSANGDCGTDTTACCRATSDCVDHNGDCQNAGACYTFGSGGKKSYCAGGTWRDPDSAQSYCSSCSFSWMSAAGKCCGDDAEEDIEQGGSGNSCCYNGSVMGNGSSLGSILCYNGLLYDCNGGASDDSGLADHKNTCDKVGTLYCSNSNTWSTGLSGVCECQTGAQCQSGYCVDGKCCNTACNAECQNCSTGTCTAVINAEDPPECATTHQCNAAGACKKKNGQSCSSAGECLSNICNDEGICCNQSCNGICKTCAGGTCAMPSNDTGCNMNCASHSITCRTYSDPANQCSGLGACKSAPQDCTYTNTGAGTQCVAPSCASECVLNKADTCDGQGACTERGTQSCGKYDCNSTSCRTSCSADSQCCGATNHCVGSQCCASIGSSTGTSCETAQDIGQTHGTDKYLLDNGEVATVTHDLVSQDANWYKFWAYESNSGCDSPSEKFDVIVEFTNNPNNEFVFDIVSASAPDAQPPGTFPPPQGCTHSWCSNDTYFRYDGQNMCPCSSSSSYHCTYDDRYFIVKVYRKSGAAPTCSSYTLQVKNGP